MDSIETTRLATTPGEREEIPKCAPEGVRPRSPDSGRTPDAFVLRCGRVDGGVGVLALDARGSPVAFKLGDDEEDALLRMKIELGSRRAFCEPSLLGHGFAASLVPRAAIASRAALLAFLRVRNVVPAGATVDHVNAVLAAFAHVWSAEPWSAGIELAHVEVAGAASGTWRIGPMWRDGRLLGIALLDPAGPIEKRRGRVIVGGELEAMAILFDPEGFAAEAIEQAFAFRRIPVPMRRDGTATCEDWIAMAAALTAYGSLRTRARATASVGVRGIECHATAWPLGRQP